MHTAFSLSTHRPEYARNICHWTLNKQSPNDQTHIIDEWKAKSNTDRFRIRIICSHKAICLSVDCCVFERQQRISTLRMSLVIYLKSLMVISFRMFTINYYTESYPQILFWLLLESKILICVAFVKLLQILLCITFGNVLKSKNSDK